MVDVYYQKKDLWNYLVCLFFFFFAILVLNLGMSTEAYRIFTVLYNVPIAKI